MMIEGWTYVRSSLLATWSETYHTFVHTPIWNERDNRLVTFQSLFKKLNSSMYGDITALLKKSVNMTEVRT